MLGARWCSGCRRILLRGRAALWGPAAVCAGGRRPAREIATREPDGSEWSISRPALALPPPTGTAADASGAVHTSGTWCADVWLGALGRSLDRPRHRPPALQQIPPAPSTPVGPGHCSAALRVVSKPSEAPPPPTGTATTSTSRGISPKCRPIRQITPKIGHFEAMGLQFGGSWL